MRLSDETRYLEYFCSCCGRLPIVHAVIDFEDASENTFSAFCPKCERIVVSGSFNHLLQEWNFEIENLT